MSNRFYFGEDNDSSTSLNDDDDDNDASSLPFPKPLDRSAFLAPNFDPSVFLSSLSNRFQTLEDLQEELRELSQSLNKELIDLVNDNYQDFLSLGSTLAGGEEKVEEIRVGLLGFQRDVSGVREKVEARKIEVETLLAEKKALRQEISKGRVLLEIAERLDELEELLRITQPQPQQTGTQEDEASANSEPNETWGDDWNNDADNVSDDEYDEGVGLPTRLRDVFEHYQIVQHLMKKHDPQHPFLISQGDRISRIHDRIRADLETQIRQEDEVKTKQKIIQIRASLEE